MEKEKCNIVKKGIKREYMNKFGNINTKTNYLYYLVNDDGEILSRPYYCIEDLGNDQYAVASLVDLREEINHNWYELVKKVTEKIDAKIKWGIMRVNRDENGRVISANETIVTPIIYDRITKDNLNTAYVEYDNKCTYIELDENSKNYGKQLLPCFFEHAINFDIEYDNFAQVELNDVVGYIPRNIVPRLDITTKEILTEDEVKSIESFLSGASVDEEAKAKYEALTKKELVRNKVRKRVS